MDATAAFVDFIVALVLRRCRDDGGARHYTTEPGCWPPPTKSRRHARDLIRRVSGHEQIGDGPSTQWRVARA